MRQSKTASVLDKSSVNLKLVPFDQRLAQQAELERRRAEEANHSNSDWSSGDQDDGSEDDMFETGLSRDHSRQSWNSSQRSQKEKLERGDKNKPAVMSTKKPVSRFRSVVSVTKPKTRDPRFDNLSGKYNEYFFKKSYEFIDTYRDNEEKLIRQKLKATKDPDQKNELSTALNILISRRQSEKNKELEKEISRTHKKREMEMVKQGKKPYYLKKNDLKQLELAERFKDIKDDRQLEKVIEKRRKHNASKAHKAMPFKRRREEE